MRFVSMVGAVLSGIALATAAWGQAPGAVR